MTAPKVTFEWRITVGNVMSMATVLVLAAIAYRDLQRNDLDHDRRLSVQEAATAQHGVRLQDQALAASGLTIQLNSLDRLMGEVRDELRTMNRRTAP